MKGFLEFLASLFGKSPKVPQPSPKTPPVPSPLPPRAIHVKMYEIENVNNKKEDSIYPIQMKGFGDKLQNEFEGLEKLNPELKALVEDLNVFTSREFKKGLTITMIGRTDEEQAWLYRNSEKYKQKPFKSPHQFNHAIDIRSRVFTVIEIKRIEDYLNKKWNRSNYYKWTAKNHTVGAGWHFHIQYVKK